MQNSIRRLWFGLSQQSSFNNVFVSIINLIFFQNVNNLQKQEKDQQILFPECFLSFPGSKNISSFDKLWMCLYCKLRDLCLDTRPSVRKSSGQTLFSTIAAHGSILEVRISRLDHWYFVLKIVLTYCEKKLFSWSRITFEIWGWRPRICKHFEVSRTVYSNSAKLWNQIPSLDRFGDSEFWGFSLLKI